MPAVKPLPFAAVTRKVTSPVIDHVATGARLAVCRKAHGIATPTQLAALVGYSPTYVALLERGERNWDAELVSHFAAVIASYSAKPHP